MGAFLLLRCSVRLVIIGCSAICCDNFGGICAGRGEAVSVKDICMPDQKSRLICPHEQVFFTASAVWCVVGHVVLGVCRFLTGTDRA